jgi:hypothetical protein
MPAVNASRRFGALEERMAPMAPKLEDMVTGRRAIIAAEFWHGSTGAALAHGLRKCDWQVHEIDARLFFLEPHSTLTKVVSRLAHWPGIRAYNAAVLAAVDRARPQVFLTVKGAWLQADTLRRLAERGVLCFNYYPDFHFEHQGLDRATLRLFDLVLTTKSFQVEYLQRLIGADRVAMLHHGYSDLIHLPRSSALQERDYFADVTYVGNYSAYKEKWLTAIARRLRQARLCIIGSRWDFAHDDLLKRCTLGHVLTGDFHARAIQHSRINVAIHGGPTGPCGWQDLVSTRTFEIPACKGFMLHIDNAEVRCLFKPGREIGVFASEDELIEKIEHYLARAMLRCEMIERAYQRCVPAYGYDARAEVISRRMTALLESRGESGATQMNRGDALL